ncbi:MAG: hypothetical protein KatS3mg027_2675 [Bacteroidia bacterium]|nr:MAG: hypothetical protein KatS3mg027_2675 [Bacteroidia bacterium]
MEGRSIENTNYRFGFQGQEGDDEVFGKDNLWAYKYRLHDARLGRFFSVDPLADKYPYNSVYAFSENRVIDGVELEGLEWKRIEDQNGNPVQGENGGYRWEGFNEDGTPKAGTVPAAAHAFESNGKKYLRIYLSNPENQSGSIELKEANEYGMVELPVTKRIGTSGEFMVGQVGYKIYNYEGNDQYGDPFVIAGAMNSAIEYSINNPGEYVSFGDFSNRYGQTFKPHLSHKAGSQFDWVIFDAKGKNIFSSSYPVEELEIRVQKFTDIAYKNGFRTFYLPSSLNGCILSPGNKQFPVNLYPKGAGKPKPYHVPAGDARFSFNNAHNNHGHTGLWKR